MAASADIPALLARLRTLDIRLWADGAALRYSAPPGSLTPALRAEIAARKAELLAFLQAASQDLQAVPPITPLPRTADVTNSTGQTFPLSFAQQRFWFLDQLAPSAATYVIPVAVQVRGTLDLPALEQSLNALLRRHEALRTTFRVTDGQPMQVIGPAHAIRLAYTDLSALSEQEREETLPRLLAAEAERSFDLHRGPLLRALTLRLAADTHILLLTMHHIVADEWSMDVVSRELSALYNAFSTGQADALPALPVQYADFAVWQRQWLNSAPDVRTPTPLATHLDYWRQQLGTPSALELPTDRPRPAVPTFRGATHIFALPNELADGLRDLARQGGATLFMTMLAAFQVLLHRYSDQDEFCIGTPIANRTRPETEPLIGCFVNTLVIRADTSGNPGFRELLRRVRATALEAYTHQDAPFEEVVAALQPVRTPGQQALFQVMFALLDTPTALLQVPGLEVTRLPITSGTAKFDLTLTLEQGAQGLRGSFEYSTDLFDAASITRMAGHFQTLLAGIVAHPDQPIGTLPLMSADERRQILVTWNATASDYSIEHCIHTLFEQQVARTPETIAVIAKGAAGFGLASVSYAELNRRANQLAHYLRKRGVGSETLVGICLPRSPELIVALLAVLKAGGAYLPLDPGYPPERLALMLADTQALVLLTQTSLDNGPWIDVDKQPPTADHPQPAVVYLDADWAQIAREPGDNPARNTVPDNLAYVIYTSGSTGVPKGVLVPHRAVVNHNLAVARRFELRPGDRVLQFATIAFDAAVEEIFPTLASGATLVLRPEGLPPTGIDLLRLIETQGLTVLDLPTAYWHSWVAELARSQMALPTSLRLVIVGGEQVAAAHLLDWLRLPGKHPVWMNSYGPTEATVIATLYELAADAHANAVGASVPIGRPLPNTQIYILDRYGQPVPIGVPGEIYIGGVGVARGYLNRPELNAERFVQLPIADFALQENVFTKQSSIYKTGDLGRYRPGGTIEFLGRRDRQIKLRGFRVEPGEIEAVLHRHPQVQETVVVADEDRLGEKRLIAYVVGRDTEESERLPAQLRAFLEERLPTYMLPTAFVMLEALPLTPSGKLDTRALPSFQQVDERTVPYVAPRTHSEALLAQLWAELMGLERVSVDADFFALGGHSLLAAQLVFRVRELFQVELPLRSFLAHTTIAGLARMIDDVVQAAHAPPTSAAPDFDAEARLDPDIRPAMPQLSLNAEPASILLTGASGFLGAFLLAELLQQTQAQIYCLVRAAHPAAAKQRIRRNLMTYQLWDPAFETRVMPIIGDLAQPRFGLDLPQFKALAATVDVIYHNGALVNFVVPYSRLKATNVDGTRDILRLATQARTIPVHYISTLSVFDDPAYLDGGVVREDDDLSRGVGPLYGYAQSKWVADRLVLQARDLGVPVSIYRPGSVTGDSRTGAWNTDDYLCRLIKGCIQLGAMPDLDKIFQFTPVDVVSRAIVTLARQRADTGKTFHIETAQQLHLRQLAAWINEHGYPLQLLPYDAWLSTLIEGVQQFPDNPLHPLLPIFMERAIPGSAQTLPELFVQGRAPRIDTHNMREGLRGTALVFPPIDDALLNTYFAFFTNYGFLEAPPGAAATSQRHTSVWTEHASARHLVGKQALKEEL